MISKLSVAIRIALRIFTQIFFRTNKDKTHPSILSFFNANKKYTSKK